MVEITVNCPYCGSEHVEEQGKYTWDEVRYNGRFTVNGTIIYCHNCHKCSEIQQSFKIRGVIN